MRDEVVRLRQEMKKNNIDCYIIFTEDFHGSEYVDNHFKCREYVSGFTGSAGRMVITMNEACLWTDGRYFIQAERQLENTGINLYKMGEPGVVDMVGYIKEKACDGWTIAFDGRTLNARAVQNLTRLLKTKNVTFIMDSDLVGNIWTDRPDMPHTKVWELNKEYSGVDRKDKISALKHIVRKKKCDYFVLSALDEISYILNLRGNDVLYNPVFLAYMIISADEDEKSFLFVQDGVADGSISEELFEDNIAIYDYNDIFAELSKICKCRNILADMSGVNAMLVKVMQDNGAKVFDTISPVMQMKAIKNDIEIRNERKAHIIDGVAVTKFIYWLKHNIGKQRITELSVVDKIEEFRRLSEDYIEPSFGTIAAYADNGAIVHYEPDEESNKELSENNFLLVDTGGHYMQGTTDITRTIALGNISDVQKKHYTAVLKGNLRLADATFQYGCRGTNLDILAREPLWKYGLDFRHGTGHGVGYLLNVHESPNSFRWKINPMTLNRNDAVLEEGMITSDEPGVYLEGEYGIRLENLILCIEDKENEYGTFMKFDTLTKVPFDIDAIDKTEMSSEDIRLLNEYHESVREAISPLLNEEERIWLEDVTKPI